MGASGINIGPVSRDVLFQAGGDIVAGNKTTVTIIVQQRTQVLASTPYKFLASYDIADRDIFYGRAAVVEQLAAAVARHRVIIINGASGSGKSSLVNAGVIPRLAENGYSYVRFREYSEPLAQFAELGEQLSVSPLPGTEIGSDNAAALPRQPATPVASPVENRETAETKAPDFNDPGLLFQLIRAAHATPIVVVLDQFERFFVNVPPEKRSAFITGVKHCLDRGTAQDITFVIALREEFFGQLTREFEAQIPVFLNEAFHLNLLPLTIAEAREAIVRPVENAKLNIQYHKDFVDQVLLHGLAAQGNESTGINPPHLQIVCNQLFDAAHQRLQLEGSVLIDEKLYNELGGAQTILNTYLDKVVEEVGRHPEQIRVVRSVLQRVIDTTGTRRFVTKNILKRELPDVNEVDLHSFVEKLGDRRVVEERPANGAQATAYSLSHEYMVQQVRAWFDPIEMERKRAQETLERGLAEWKNSQALLSRPQVESVRKWVTSLSPEEQKLLQDSQANYTRQEREEAQRERQLEVSKIARRRNFRIGFGAAIVLTAIALGFAWRSYQETKLALARQLVAQADQAKKEGPDLLEPSALLSIESAHRAALFENDSALRQVLALSPRQVVTLSQNLVSITFIDDHPLAFSSDGRYLSAASDKGVQVFEAATGKEISHPTQRVGVHMVAFSPDGRYLATTSDKGAQVFETTTGKELSPRPVTQGGPVYGVAFSPDGRYFAASSDKGAQVFETATGKELSHSTWGDFVRAIAFSPDGRYVTARGNQTAQVFEATTGMKIRLLNESYDALSPDGRLLSTENQVFEAATGNELSKLIHERRDVLDDYRRQEFSPDGRYIATASERVTQVFETITGRELWRLHGAIHALAFSPDSRYVAIAAKHNAEVLETATGKVVSRVTGVSDVIGLAISPNGRYLATGSEDKTIRVFENASSSELIRITQDRALRAFALSLNGRYLATGSEERSPGVRNCYWQGAFTFGPKRSCTRDGAEPRRTLPRHG